MRRVLLGFLFVVLVVAALVFWLHRGAKVEQASTFPEVRLGEVQNKALPGSVPNDRGMLLGGLGSGLFSVGHNEFWTITDRGPNGEPADDIRTFIVPEFTPTLVKVRVSGSALRPLKYIPLVTSEGQPVTGLPPFIRAGDPRAAVASGRISEDLKNPNGLDTEGVVATVDGFWPVARARRPSGPRDGPLCAEGHREAV